MLLSLKRYTPIPYFVFLQVCRRMPSAFQTCETKLFTVSVSYVLRCSNLYDLTPEESRQLF